MINTDELNKMVDNLSEMIVCAAESIVSGRDNETLLLNILLTRTCAEMLSCNLIIAGNEHIDRYSNMLFKEIIERAKTYINTKENDS